MPALRALLLVALSSSACACAASDKYPSLAIRDAERVAGTMQPVAPAPAAAPALPAETLDRVDRLAAEANSAHQAFLGEAPQVRRAVDAAHGVAPGGDSWARAQVALAGLEATRSRSMIALADLDRIFVDTALDGADIARVAGARDRVAAQVGEQDAVISEMLGSLR